MASSFPGAIDNFTDPLANSSLASPSHAGQHSDLNDAVEKIETYMGLVKVIPTSVTGGTLAANGTVTIGNAVTSVTVSGAFSSLYDSYRVLIEVNDTNGTASNTLQFSGITTSTYLTGGSYGSWGGATQTGYGPSFSTSFIASANTLNGTNTQITWEIANPNIARRKQGTIFAQAGNGHMSMNVLCSSTSTTTGFVLAKSGDTMTGGTIRVYGYRN